MFASTENPIVIKPPPMRTGPGKQQNHLSSYVKNMNYRSQQKVGYSCTPPWICCRAQGGQHLVKESVGWYVFNKIWNDDFHRYRQGKENKSNSIGKKREKDYYCQQKEKKVTPKEEEEPRADNAEDQFPGGKTVSSSEL